MSSAGDIPGTAAEPDAETVAAAALACEGVHALTRGTDVVEIATYLPGRRVHGVRVAPGRAEVHIVTEYGANVVEVADRVRAAVLAAVSAPRSAPLATPASSPVSTDAPVEGAPLPQVDVFVDDIHGPEEQVEPSLGEPDIAPPGVPGEVP